jgi:hypothetical protein
VTGFPFLLCITDSSHCTNRKRHTLRFSLLTVHIETANFKDLAYYTERDERVFPAYCAYEERQNLKFSCLLCKGAYGERQALRFFCLLCIPRETDVKVFHSCCAYRGRQTLRVSPHTKFSCYCARVHTERQALRFFCLLCIIPRETDVPVFLLTLWGFLKVP